MDGQPIILRLAHAVLCARSSDEAERAFAALVAEDRPAALGVRAVLVRAVPNSAPVWQSILDHEAQSRQPEVDRESGPPLATCDAVDTARDIAGQMGWRDMEPSK